MKRPIVLLAVLTLLGSTGKSQAAFLINNGGFEAGFTNWTVVNQANGNGNWFVQSGTSSPQNAFPVPPPPELIRAAMTDQGGPGSHVLYQDFVVPVGVSSATLSFQRFIGNLAGVFVNGAQGLDYTGAANQQARVDIMLASATPFSVASGDILQNVFQTNPGDPFVSGYSAVSANLTALLSSRGGQTFRLRFAETDNRGFFQFGVDAVQLEANSVNPVPAPAGLLLAMTGLPLLVGMMRRRLTPAVAS